MTDDEKCKIELIAESAAQRQLLALMAEAIQTFAAVNGSNFSAQVHQVLARRLEQKRGELLYSAPPDLDPKVQAVWNRRFQSSFEDLSGELLSKLASPPGKEK